MLRRLKPLMLPIAILGGVIFYKWMDKVTFLSPYLIFMMLVITYCRIEPCSLRIGKFQIVMLTVQLLLSGIVYLSLVGFSNIVATGVFICVFIPTATAAPVITGMLGGSISRLVTFSLLSNLSVALTGPWILAAIGDHPEMTFMESFKYICALVLPLLLFPIAIAFILRYAWRKAHAFLATRQEISFYIWALSLFIVVGGSVSFVINDYSPETLQTMIWLAIGALVVCLLQFAIGKWIGKRYGDKVSGGQGMGQKNTVLAIWLAMAYLNPLASVAPAAYVAWQNIINSWEIYRHKRLQ